MDQETEIAIAELKATISVIVDEINKIKIGIAKIESAQKIIRTEALGIKTMSDKLLPTISDLMGRNGRKGA